MPDAPRPLDHQDIEKKSDEVLQKEARAHLADAPAIQLVAELSGKLRSLNLSWWTPDALRARWSATDRMRWLAQRPDVRQRITTSLTGLAPRAARKKTPEFQGALIDSAIDEGDISVRAFEDAFDPADLAAYGPAEEMWNAFVDRMPWGEDSAAHQDLAAWLFDAVLADRSHIEGLYRKPIMSAWDARTAIDGRVWHTRMPLQIRVAIDEARFKKERERPGEPFHAESDLSIAVAATIASSIPLRDLAPVFHAAAAKMGFGGRAREPAAKTGEAARPKPADPAPPAAAPAAAAATAAARKSIAPPPQSITPPPPGPQSVAPRPALGPPPSHPPPPIPAYQPPPNIAVPKRTESSAVPAAKPEPAKAEPAKLEPAKTEPAKPAAAGRQTIATIPDGMHEVPVDDENTNPWDIPTDVNAETIKRRTSPGKE